ncbi:MAG: Plug domain-containing protein [Sneathiella sp.]|nr:Plug domain-containing protein [Sneathiella sp.]
MKQKLLLGTALACLFAPVANAEENSRIQLEPIEVIGSNRDEKSTLTVPSNEEAREIIERTPGGVDLVTEAEIENKFSQSYEDSLSMVPGVTAKKRFGEEVRLTIRGSGLSRGFHLRGLKLLQDGVPFNQADGAGDFQELDPKATQRIEVYKGGNALEHGGVRRQNICHRLRG